MQHTAWNPWRMWFLAAMFACTAAYEQGRGAVLSTDIRRVVFLGDSITYSGKYVVDVELICRAWWPERRLEWLNLGLPSETVSGLTEPGHADGRFPRPDLHERLDRVLALTKPDLVIACYGMNDGVYHPFDERRFAAFRSGIERLRAKVQGAGARIIHLTPSVFDAVAIRERTLPDGQDEYRQPYAGYDDVLARYSSWLLDQRTHGWEVIDVHGPMSDYLQARRKSQPEFSLAADGVHLNDEGHWLLAREVLCHFDAPREVAESGDVIATLSTLSGADGVVALEKIRQKQRVLTDAWLTSIGHQRPEINPGITLVEATEQAAALDDEINRVFANGVASK